MSWVEPRDRWGFPKINKKEFVAQTIAPQQNVCAHTDQLLCAVVKWKKEDKKKRESASKALEKLEKYFKNFSPLQFDNRLNIKTLFSFYVRLKALHLFSFSSLLTLLACLLVHTKHKMRTYCSHVKLIKANNE